MACFDQLVLDMHVRVLCSTKTYKLLHRVVKFFFKGCWGTKHFDFVLAIQPLLPFPPFSLQAYHFFLPSYHSQSSGSLTKRHICDSYEDVDDDSRSLPMSSGLCLCLSNPKTSWQNNQHPHHYHHLLKTQRRDLNRQVLKENVQMAKKYMEKYSTSPKKCKPEP